jgi:hypothetical protein
MIQVALIVAFAVSIQCWTTTASTGTSRDVSVHTLPLVDLLENSAWKSTVVVLDSSTRTATVLNLHGFERDMFSVIDGRLVTSSDIDREAIVDKKQCSNATYCLIEVHLLVMGDALAYCIVPVHIVE